MQEIIFTIHDVNNAEGIHINIVSLTFRRKQYSPYASFKQMQRENTTIELASNYAGNNIHLTHDVNNAEGIHINRVSLTFLWNK